MVFVILDSFYYQEEVLFVIVIVCNDVVVKVNIVRIGIIFVQSENKVLVVKDYFLDQVGIKTNVNLVYEVV